MLMHQRWITISRWKMHDGRGFCLLQRDKKRISFIARFPCAVIKEIRIWHVVGLHSSSSASPAFNASSVTAVAVKWETADVTAGSAWRHFSLFFFFFLRAPAFCRFCRKLVWFECQELKQSLPDSAQSAPLCTEAQCHLLTSMIRGFILWTLGCGGCGAHHLLLNYIKTQGRGRRCRGNLKK